ncbi:MAG: hypothetical protein U0804_06510 [Gemmataceae bacterium]
MPELPDHPLDLNPEQRQYLVGLRKFVAEPPTAAGLYAKALPRMVVLTLIFGGLAAGAWWFGVPWATWFCLGALAGLLLMVSENVKRAARLWPATAAVVDWDRLDRLLGEYDPNRDRP